MKYNYIVRTSERGKPNAISESETVLNNNIDIRITPRERTSTIEEDLPSKVIHQTHFANIYDLCPVLTTNEVRVYKGRHYSCTNTNRLPRSPSSISGLRSTFFTLSKYPKYMPSMIKIYDVKWNPIIPKVVVFDLDETIGNFSDLYLIWTAIFNTGIYTSQPNPKIAQLIFNELLDLYPEFLRYGILHILDFIRTKIQNGESHRIYLYTNNQCIFAACPDSRNYTQPSPTEWVEMIIIYLNMKLSAVDTIFAKPICAFKIGSRVIEPLRQTNSKTHRDFLKCAVLPKNTEICFVDDTYHSKMVHNKVYYIQPPPYVHGLSQMTIIDRFMVSSLYTKLNTNSVDSRYFENMFVNNSISLHKHIKTLSGDDKYSTGYLNGVTTNPNIHNTNLPTLASSIVYNSCVPALSKIESHKEVYKKMMYYIKEFFCLSSKISPTKRRNIRIGKFTRKKIPHNR